MEEVETFEKATDALKHDHRVMEKVLAVLERLVDFSGDPSMGLWEKTVNFIRGFADRCHQLKEEKILFPALEERGMVREGGPIGIMLAEHEEGRKYTRAMSVAVAFGKGDPEATIPTLLENGRAYLRLLRDHIRKEEEVLFELADGLLTREEQRALAREFEEYEAKEIGPGAHEGYLKLAEELERFPGKNPPSGVNRVTLAT
jgi:hemerythrin-like domain-containing protein